MDALPNWLKKYIPTDACVVTEKSIELIVFCYGAKVVVLSIKHPKLPLTVKVAIVAHSSFLVKEKAKPIKRPILFLCAENDQIFILSLRQEFEKELTSTGLGTCIEYPGAVHGFVVRPNDSQQVIQQRDKAVQDIIRFCF